MNTNVYPAIFDVDDEGELIKFSELAGRMAIALHPDDVDSFARAVTERQLATDLISYIDSGALRVRTSAGRGDHPFPVGAALDSAVLFPQDLENIFRDRGIAIRALWQKVADENQAIRYGEGRYTPEEAARLISDSGEAVYEAMLNRLERACNADELASYAPSSKLPNEFSVGLVKGRFSRVATYYDECYWDDLNSWLAVHERRIAFRFSDPSTRIRLHAALSSISQEGGQGAASAAATMKDGAPADCERSWQDQAREIANELHKRDSNAGAFSTPTAMADRVAPIMRERGIYGPRGPLAPTTILREALSKAHWKRPT